MKEANLKFLESKFKLDFNHKINSLLSLQLKHHKFIETSVTNEYLSELSDIKNIIELIKILKEKNIYLKISNEVHQEIEKFYNQLKKSIDNLKLLELIKEGKFPDDFQVFREKLLKLKRKLLEHQIKSCYHLFKAKNAANFSVPGSGKSSVVIAYYEYLRLEKKIDAIFIIGPKSCFYSWENEFIETLGRNPNVKFLDETSQKRKKIYLQKLKTELLTCHFSTAVNDTEQIINFLKSNNILLVIDEAHNIKKIDGTWSNTILRFSNYAKFKIILTGTPMPNDFKDFYNYFDFLFPDKEILSNREKAQIEIFSEKKETDQASNLLNMKIMPYYFRVTKKDLGLLMPKFNKPKIITMNNIERTIYDAILTKMKFIEDEKYINNLDFINKIRRARIIRLRQTCSYVRNLKNTLLDYDLDDKYDELRGDKDIQRLIAYYDRKEEPEKLNVLLNMVSDLSNKKNKVIVWSGHLMSIDLIFNKLLQYGLNIAKITGKTDLHERELIKKEFNDPESKLDVIVANPAACSESISLHKDCKNAIYYDLNYNSAEFLQSLDRIHRVGGSENIIVEYDFLQYQNTIDTKIFKRVLEKADLQMKTIEKDNSIFSNIESDNHDILYAESIK